jgi:hypothetical protein
VKRIAYDADTQVYTFRDGKGKLYRGPPGEEYGRLTPINTGTIDRPDAFDSGECFFVRGLLLKYRALTSTIFQETHTNGNSPSLGPIHLHSVISSRAVTLPLKRLPSTERGVDNPLL